jgi:hypothetical protein
MSDMQHSSSSLNMQNGLVFRILIAAIILLGVILRASKYLPGWSMRGDELFVTLNLLNRSAFDLATKPLDYEQAAPFGFLLLVKTLIILLGQSEYVLRLVAFVSGCISLVLMYKLLSKTSGAYGTILGLLALASGFYAIYYSSELKQYSSDVLVCLVLLLVFHRHISRDTQKKDFWELGVVGALAICFSHPAIFVAIAIGATLLVHYWNDRRKLIWITIVGAVWAGIFLVIYLMLLRYQTTSNYLVGFWRDLNSYMPLRPWRNFSWFPSAIEHLFANIAGLSNGILIILIALYLYGLWMFWNEKQWQWIGVSILPIGINMIVSGFEKFPFHGRLIMYLIPLVLLVFAKAVDGLIAWIRNPMIANTVFIALSILLLQPALPTAQNFLITQTYLRDDLHPVLSYVQENRQGSDMAYLYHYVNGQFQYYASQYDLEDMTTVSGQNYSRNAKKYQDELSSLPRGQRIWFIFSFVGEARVNKNDKQSERDYILNYLKEQGMLLDEFYSTNDASSAHLFLLK